MSDSVKSGMSGASTNISERVTFRLSEDLLDEIRSLVEQGEYENISEALRDGAETIVDSERRA